MADFNDNINNKTDTVNTVKSRKNSGQFQKGMKQPDKAGRKKETPIQKTRKLLELLGEYLNNYENNNRTDLIKELFLSTQKEIDTYLNIIKLIKNLK